MRTAVVLVGILALWPSAAQTRQPAPRGDSPIVVRHLGLRIQGAKEFVQRTCAALDLLRKTPYLARVRRDIAVVKQGERSGARPYDKESTYEVGARTWQAEQIWYASTIVHDAYHAHLYHVAPRNKDGSVPDSAWTGAKAEQKCLRVQLDALRRLHASQRTVDYVRGLLKHPRYQGDPSSWRDYRKRDW